MIFIVLIFNIIMIFIMIYNFIICIITIISSMALTTENFGTIESPRADLPLAIGAFGHLLL